MPKKVIYMYADFETTSFSIPDGFRTYKEYYQKVENPKFPEVYSWGVLYKNDKPIGKSGGYRFNEELGTHFNYGISITSFIEYITSIDCDVKVFFNNSKGFDAHFIYPELDRLGFNQVLPFEDEEIEKNFTPENVPLIKEMRNNRVLKIANNLRRGAKFKLLSPEMIGKKVKQVWNTLIDREYRMLTNNMNHILKITISSDRSFWSMGRKRNRVIQICDNLLLFAGSIAKIGETCAKIHIKKGMDPQLAKERFSKLSIFYDRKEKYKSIEEFENDVDEFNYLERDIYILFEYHNLIEEFFPRISWKMTSASTTYSMWLKQFTEDNIVRLKKEGVVKEKKTLRGAIKLSFKNKLYSSTQFGDQLIKRILPTKWLDEPDEEFGSNHQNVYNWYYGGISFVNENFRGQYLENISVLDINSSYPSSMISDLGCPIGEPIKNPTEDQIKKISNNFILYELEILGQVKNEKGLPFLIPVYSNKRHYPKILNKGELFYINSIELEFFKKYYTNDIKKYKLTPKWVFETTPIKNLFGSFITKYYKMKEEASVEKNEVIKLIAKLFLNSLYGKFATKKLRSSKTWLPEKGLWVDTNNEIESKFYLPVALFITSLSRLKLVEAVDTNFDRFVYCDTDSIFIKDFKIEDFKNVELHSSKIGCWDIEGENLRGVVRRPKQYLLFDQKGKRKVAFAGINFNRSEIVEDYEIEIDNEVNKIIDTLSINDFIEGRQIVNQLSPFKVIGKGIIIQTSFKNIKPVWDYKPLPEQIYYLPDHFKKFKIIRKNTWQMRKNNVQF